jgi:hypothetical protein
MNGFNHKSVIDAWIQYHSTPKKKEGCENLFWAWEYVTDLVFKEPEQAWPIILELVKQAPTNRILFDVAAGPFEDLIRQHGEQFIDRIEVQARRDPKFRQCLAGIWYGEDVSKDIRNRIEKYTSSG